MKLSVVDRSLTSYLTLGTLFALLWISSVSAAGVQDPNQQLRDWAASGRTEPVRNLLAERDSQKVDIDSRDSNGWTALMHAANGGHAPIVRLLLDAGANPHLENDAKETALHLAAAAQAGTEAVRLLLEAGADFAASDASGRTPLYRAIEHRRAENIELLQAAAQVVTGSSQIRVVEESGFQEETTPPVIVRSDPAPYTESARDKGVEGIVVLMVLVRRDGSIGGISVSKSLEESLDQSALQAVRKWEFQPATRGGQAVNVVIEVPIEFALPKKR